MGLEKEAGNCSHTSQLSRVSKKSPRKEKESYRGAIFGSLANDWEVQVAIKTPLDLQLQDAAEKPEDCQLHLTRNQLPEVIAPETRRMEPVEKFPNAWTSAGEKTQLTV